MNDHDRELAERLRFAGAAVRAGARCRATRRRWSGWCASRTCRPAGRVLDAGCGPGLVAAALLASGLRVVGVDLSARDDRAGAEPLRGVRATGRRSCRSRSSTRPWTQLGPFDGAISRYVLHHVRRPRRLRRHGRSSCCGPAGCSSSAITSTDPDPARADHHEAPGAGPRPHAHAEPHRRPDRRPVRRGRPDGDPR